MFEQNIMSDWAGMNERVKQQHERESKEAAEALANIGKEQREMQTEYSSLMTESVKQRQQRDLEKAKAYINRRQAEIEADLLAAERTANGENELNETASTKALRQMASNINKSLGVSFAQDNN